MGNRTQVPGGDYIKDMAAAQTPAEKLQVSFVKDCLAARHAGVDRSKILSAVLGTYLSVAWCFNTEVSSVQAGLRQEAEKYPDTARRMSMADSDA